MLGTPTLTANPSFPNHLRAAVADVTPADRRSLHEVLGVKQNASQAEARTAYRTLAKLYHSDPTSRFTDSSVASAVADVTPADRWSPYEVLRVNQNASQAEIRAAYRTLVKLYHPDATSRFVDSAVAPSPDGREFINIQKAYAILSDPHARAMYDLKLNSNSRNTAGVPAYRSTGRGKFNRTRRTWETDQCW